MSTEKNVFKQNLLQRKRKNMHEEFFSKNPFLEQIKVPIFSKWTQKKHIIPFRSINCSKPNCIYDLQDLMNLYEASLQHSIQSATCYSCGNLLNLQNFYLDYSLKVIIDSIWQHSSDSDNFPFDSVSITRNGKWIANRAENAVPDLKKHFSVPDCIRGAQSPKQMRTIVKEKKPLHLVEFDEAEFEKLLQKFEKTSASSLDMVVTRDGLKILREDVKYLLHDDSISQKIMTLFLNYFNTLSKYDQLKQNRCLILGFEGVKYDPKNENIQYKYANKLKIRPGMKLPEIKSKFDKMIIVISLDGRWVIAVVELSSEKMYIIDFLSAELSKVDSEELSDTINCLISTEFDIQNKAIEFYKGQKLKYISDCGIYALNYVYKCLNNNLVESIKAKFEDKGLFQRQLVWFLLKSATQENDIHFVLPPSQEPVTLPGIGREPASLSKLNDFGQAVSHAKNRSIHLSPQRMGTGRQPTLEDIRYNSPIFSMQSADYQRLRPKNNNLENLYLKKSNLSKVLDVQTYLDTEIDQGENTTNTSNPLLSYMGMSPKGVKTNYDYNANPIQIINNNKLPPIRQGTGSPDPLLIMSSYYVNSQANTPKLSSSPIKRIQNFSEMALLKNILGDGEIVDESNNETESSNLSDVLAEIKEEQENRVKYQKAKNKIRSLLQMKQRKDPTEL